MNWGRYIVKKEMMCKSQLMSIQTKNNYNNNHKILKNVF